MEEAHAFTIDVAQDARQRGRYRWSISENMKVRDTSFYSFATRREAQADANKFVEKLKAMASLMTKTPKPPRDLNQRAKRMVDIATGETSDREPTPPTSGESVASALDRWDEEGGAPAALRPLPYEAGDLPDVERRVLECLGAALVGEWNGLPTTFSAGSSSTRRRANHTTLPC